MSPFKLLLFCRFCFYFVVGIDIQGFKTTNTFIEGEKLHLHINKIPCLLYDQYTFIIAKIHKPGDNIYLSWTQTLLMILQQDVKNLTYKNQCFSLVKQNR